MTRKEGCRPWPCQRKSQPAESVMPVELLRELFWPTFSAYFFFAGGFWPLIRFNLHKEFRTTDMWIYLHKLSRQAPWRIGLYVPSIVPSTVWGAMLRKMSMGKFGMQGSNSFEDRLIPDISNVLYVGAMLPKIVNFYKENVSRVGFCFARPICAVYDFMYTLVFSSFEVGRGDAKCRRSNEEIRSYGSIFHDEKMNCAPPDLKKFRSGCDLTGNDDFQTSELRA